MELTTQVKNILATLHRKMKECQGAANTTTFLNEKALKCKPSPVWQCTSISGQACMRTQLGKITCKHCLLSQQLAQFTKNKAVTVVTTNSPRCLVTLI